MGKCYAFLIPIEISHFPHSRLSNVYDVYSIYIESRATYSRHCNRRATSNFCHPHQQPVGIAGATRGRWLVCAANLHARRQCAKWEGPWGDTTTRLQPNTIKAMIECALHWCCALAPCRFLMPALCFVSSSSSSFSSVVVLGSLCELAFPFDNYPPHGSYERRVKYTLCASDLPPTPYRGPFKVYVLYNLTFDVAHAIEDLFVSGPEEAAQQVCVFKCWCICYSRDFAQFALGVAWARFAVPQKMRGSILILICETYL